MLWLRKVLSVAAVAVFAVALTAQDRTGDEKDPAKKLAGTYTIVSGKHGKDPIPAGDIQGALVTFTNDKIVATDKDKKETYVATYSVEAGSKPTRLKMKSIKPAVAEATGLVKWTEKGELHLIYNLPGGAVPTDFEPKENQHLFVLKKVEK